MTTYSLLTLTTDPRGIASVTLNRPEVHNAFNAELIAELTQVFEQLDKDAKVRLAVLSGAGKSFCAGGDMNWMKSTKHFSREENIADGGRLAGMFERIQHFSKPLIGVVHGVALGGGTGLAAVCDYVLATQDAQFGLTEVRLGLIPATISPYVMEKIGLSAARAYFISGMRFSAETAKELGLVHRIVARAELEKAQEETIAEFLKAGPEAACAAKALAMQVARRMKQHDPASLTAYTVEQIAEIRIGAEAQEGMGALLEGRKPNWVEG